MLRSSPVIFICGPTGSGKTAVSIKLAQELKGEVINADAYQMYKGLDIATAKITRDEMQGVPHHLLSLFDPKERVNVTDFIGMAEQTIVAVQERGHVPIVVGGSNFYVESLLFNNPLLQPEARHEEEEEEDDKTVTETETEAEQEGVEERSSAENYARLKELDHAAASVLHPRDSRRVLRALQRHLAARPTPSSPLPLRYHRSVVVHVSCRDQQQHVAGLHARVDAMLARGLEQEARLLHQYLCAPFPQWEDYLAVSGAAARSTAAGAATSGVSSGCHLHSGMCRVDVEGRGGVTEAIGFKEFLPYFDQQAESAQGVEFGEAGALLTKAVADIKHSTVQYAKRQATWLRNRLVPRCLERGVPVLDYCPGGSQAAAPAATHCSLDSLLAAVALTLQHQQLESGGTNAVRVPCSVALQASHRPGDQGACLTDHLTLKRKIFQCEVCSQQCFQGQEQFAIHTSSKKHKKRAASLRKLEQRRAEGRGGGEAVT